MADYSFLNHFITEDIYLIDGAPKLQSEKTDDKISIVTSSTLSSKDHEFLLKIFSSVQVPQDKLDLRDTVDLITTKPTISFFFGVQPPGNKAEFYKIVKNDERTVIMAHDLSEIAQDDAKKRLLWNVLKDCFG